MSDRGPADFDLVGVGMRMFEIRPEQDPAREVRELGKALTGASQLLHEIRERMVVSAMCSRAPAPCRETLRTRRPQMRDDDPQPRKPVNTTDRSGTGEPPRSGADPQWMRTGTAASASKPIPVRAMIAGSKSPPVDLETCAPRQRLGHVTLSLGLG